MKKLIIIIGVLILSSFHSANEIVYLFGNLHAHSSYSDGCKKSPNIKTPLECYQYASESQNFNFLGISDHNHMLTKNEYHDGLNNEALFNKNSQLIALYGMEWGKDQVETSGHVIIFNYSNLIGWEPHEFDDQVSETDYKQLFYKVAAEGNSFAYLAHPKKMKCFSNLLQNNYDKIIDDAIVGMAVRTSKAQDPNNTYSLEPNGLFYAYYDKALLLGYHLGAGFDHDNHYSNFGRSTQGRTVVLVKSVNREELIAAMKSMMFYSSDDWNAKVDFKINNKPMGSIIESEGKIEITLKITDDDNDPVKSIVMVTGFSGYRDGRIDSSLIVTETNTFTRKITLIDNAEHFYYFRILQNDGDLIITSPIWCKKKA